MDCIAQLATAGHHPRTVGPCTLLPGQAHALQARPHPCHPFTQCKQDLTYTVKHSQKRGQKAVLLSNVTAHLNPGEMSALVRKPLSTTASLHSSV